MVLIKCRQLNNQSLMIVVFLKHCTRLPIWDVVCRDGTVATSITAVRSDE